jgi:expansin (peptidoglycan-binding protein)
MGRFLQGAFAALLAFAGCNPTGHDAPPLALGASHRGQYNLGPVAWTGSFTNSCAPYPDGIQAAEGDFLAGLALGWNGDGRMCDACVSITTGRGKTVVARVITTGETQGPDDIDLSQAAYDAINEDEYPRDMTWQISKCPLAGPIAYQFQTGANVYWTSLWVRNVRVPVQKVEVKSANHSDWFALKRGNDGTYTDAGGFGAGPFFLQVTSIDSQVVSDAIPLLQPGALVESQGQFQ